jgi:hypothetical protein
MVKEYIIPFIKFVTVIFSFVSIGMIGWMFFTMWFSPTRSLLIAISTWDANIELFMMLFMIPISVVGLLLYGKEAIEEGVMAKINNEY